MQLRVASWNIWTWDERKPKEIADIIRENNIDIIGLQEVATYFEEDGKWNVAEEIAKELDYNYRFCVAHDFRPDESLIEGNAVISRYPIETTFKKELNPEDVEYDGSYETIPRVAIKSTLNIENRKLDFLTTHLQYAYKFQTTEIILNQIDNVLSLAEECENPLILTGDFNSKLDSQEIDKIRENLTRIGTEKPTWTTKPFDHEGFEVNKLKYRLDNIFLNDSVEVEDTELVESNLSDHLLVIADINVKPQSK